MIHTDNSIINIRKLIIIAALPLICLFFTARPLSAKTPADPISLTLNDAVLTVLENNSAFTVQRLSVDLSRQRELIEMGAFDPQITGSLTHSDPGTSESTEGALALSQTARDGTQYGIDFSLDRTNSARSEDYTTSLRLSMTKPLLRGAGEDVVLASLRKAELATISSQYQLQAYAEELVAQVEETYWDYVLAGQKMKIAEESMEIARKQLEQTEILVEVGKIAGVELTAARAEMASRNEDVINARSQIETLRLRLLRLLNLPGGDFWNQPVVADNDLQIPDFQLAGVEDYVEVALDNRPDLNDARILLQQGDIDVVKTRNGLLPVMDFYISLGRTGYADSFSKSVANVTGDDFDFRVGFSYKQTLDRKTEKARHEAAVITQEQRTEALNNLELLAQEDVRAAWTEVRRAGEQITATAATRRLQEDKYRFEVEKFHVGKSTALLVAQAGRDLMQSRIAEQEAAASYLKSITALYRLQGTLLARRGISLSS